MSITRLSPPRLRTVAEAEHRSATWLELFYDLAFVVAVAILADRLHHDVGLIGLLSYFAYFGLLWWLWVSHTYYADRYDTDDLVYRLLAAGQMLAIVVIGAALTTGDANSTRAFAIAFAAARVLLLLMYLRAYLHVRETRALVGGYLRGFGLGAVVWISSAVGPDDARVVLWAVALTIDLATPWVLRREQARVPLDVSHLPERFGLFTILVLGESIAAVVAGLGHTSWSVLPTVTSALAIGIATTLWWMYFDNVSGSVVRRRPDTGPTWRPTVWLYSHLPLAAALAATGVALEVAVSEAGQQLMSGAGRWLLVGSISAVLASLAVIEFATTDRVWLESRSIVLSRVAGIPLLVFLGLMSAVEPVWIVSGVLVVCAGQLLCDMFAGGVQVSRDATLRKPSNGGQSGEIVIRDAPDEHAYVIEVEEERAGKAVYRVREGRHVFVHTEIEPGFAGAGLGTMLVRFALEDIRSRGRLAVPICPFFASFIEEHPEFLDIVDHQALDRYRSRAGKDKGDD